ncbi:MAG: hydroxyacylglutathione hydrolase [Congregibacter sp.]
MTSVHSLAAFDDNYIWLLDNGDGSAIVVDPGDAGPVEKALAERGLRLHAILLTHHHFDHVGGVNALKTKQGCEVYGPVNPSIADIDKELRCGDSLHIGSFHFDILAVPGHTLDHIAYYQALPESLLFCGDTLFAGGCGRIFEGDPAMMYASLQKLAALPGDTAVYCAHEYTLANLRFARAADPDNTALAERERQAKLTREKQRPTVPSTIALELATNPFLRSHDASVRSGLDAAGKPVGMNEIETFAQLRAWKDNF